jgi:predicted lipoprotein with Yx(FWY)xxD motif
MPLRNPLSPALPRRTALSLAIAIVGFATAMLVGIAIAKSFTLKVEKNAKVTNTSGVTKRKTIVTNHGFAVYTLTGDSQNHPKCISAQCLQAWPAVTVSSAKKLSKAPGIKGKLGVWHHKGMNQVTLGGHPLYHFSGDSGNGAANGEGIVAFGGTWHVVKASAAKASGSGSSGSGSSSTSMSSSSTTTSAWG